MDESFSDISKDLSSGAYKISDKVKHEVGELSDTIEKIHQDVCNERREITGGYIEYKTVEVLHKVEKKLNDIIKKFDEELE